MKSLKTYNMPQDVIQILARQPNKSAHVAKCVREYHKNKAKFDKYSLDEIELIKLLILKTSDSKLKAILNEEWSRLK